MRITFAVEGKNLKTVNMVKPVLDLFNVHFACTLLFIPARTSEETLIGPD